MPAYLYRFMVLLVFLLVKCVPGHTQQYIFIEADGQQAFYAKWGEKVYSSSTAGFLIIPKVTVPVLDLVIGFPGNRYPERVFVVRPDGQDKGFQLKRFEDGGWGLFDRTSMDLNRGSSVTLSQAAADPTKKTDNFGSLLAEATNDPGLILKRGQGLTDSIHALKDDAKAARSQPQPMQINNRRSVTGVNNPSISVDAKEPTTAVVVKEGTLTAGVVKIAEDSNSHSVKMVFVDRDSMGAGDTIDVQFARASQDAVAAPVPAPVYASAAVSAPAPFPSPAPVTASASVESPVIKPFSTSCDKPAVTEKEFRNIQKKLLGTDVEAVQVEFVAKALKSRCISSQQALELGSYFPSESLKLDLYRRIHPFLSDPENFKAAVFQFSDKANQVSIRQLMGMQ